MYVRKKAKVESEKEVCKGNSRVCTEKGAALAAPVPFLVRLLTMAIRTFVLRRVLRAGAVFRSVALRTVVCIVCICRVGRIICVVRTHDI